MYFVVACLCGLAFGEYFHGAFIVSKENRRNTIEYVFSGENATIDISFVVAPETAKMQILICNEHQQTKAEENDVVLECEVSKKANCEYSIPSTNSVTKQIALGEKAYGKYYIHLLPCNSVAVVNWTANFANGAAGRSQLGGLLLPAPATFYTSGLLWCFLALAYLFTLRRHWRKAQRVQKFIAAYPIMKVVFAYYAASFYNKYGVNGSFTTSSWAWYWTFSIGLQLGLDVLLMLLSKTGSNGIRVSIFDIASILCLTVGQALLSVVQCSADVSQLAHLLMWIIQTTLYVMMVCYILSGMTRRLQKTANILRYSIRHSTQATRHRLNRLRTSHVRELERQQRQERQQRAQQRQQPQEEQAQEQPSDSSASKENVQDVVHDAPNDDNNNTKENANNDIEIINNTETINNTPTTNNTETTINTDTTDIIETTNDTETTNTTTNNAATTDNSNNDNDNDNSNDNENRSASEPDTALSRLESSISYMLPYIWFMRHQLFVSFMFVLIVWIVLQIAMYFVNLVFGSSTLNWVKLLTTEVIDFVVFSGIIYTFTMSSRPFTISTRQDTPDRPGSYIPLGPISSHPSENEEGEENEARQGEGESASRTPNAVPSAADAEDEEDDDEAEDRPLRRLPRV